MIDLNTLFGITEDDVINLHDEEQISSKAIYISESSPLGLANFSTNFGKSINLPSGNNCYDPSLINMNSTSSSSQQLSSNNNKSIWRKVSAINALTDLPCTPMIGSTFHKLSVPSFNAAGDTYENLQTASILPTYQCSYISRVLLLSCDVDSKKLDNLVKVTIDPLTIIAATQIMIGEHRFVAIGWFDLRNISNGILALKQAAFNQGFSDLEFTYIKDNTTFNQVTNTQNFRFLEDCYDTMYFSLDNSDFSWPNSNI